MATVNLIVEIPDDIQEVSRALVVAWNLMEELREDMPWRDEPEEAQSIIHGVFTDLYKHGIRQK